MLKKTIFFIVYILIINIYSENKDGDKIDLIAGIDIEAIKVLSENQSNNNFDALWGRAVLGTSIKKGKFSGKVVMRAYPAAFGYNVLRGVEYDTAYDILTTEANNIAKIQVNNAWFAWNGKVLDIKIGRSGLYNSHAWFWGNYTDEGPGGYFMGKGITSNLFELSKTVGKFSTSLNVTIESSNFNNGNMRLFESIKLIDQLDIGIGYSNNAIDFIKSSNRDNDFLNNLDFQVAAFPVSSMTIFAELGIYQFGGTEDPEIPLCFGVKVPTGKILDCLQFEIEWENQRADNNNAILWGVHIQKKFLNHFKINYAIYSENQTTKDVSMGLRFSAFL